MSKYTTAQINDAKNRVKTFKTKNNRNPNSVKVGNDTLTWAEYTKLISTTTTTNTRWLNPPKTGQDTSYYCACASLQQCFYHLTGKYIEEKTIAKIAGTTTSGTSHDGINTAVAWFNKTYNTSLKIKWYNFTDLGSWENIKKEMNKTNQAVFFHLKYANGGECKKDCLFGHYESARSINTTNNTITVNNSLGSKNGTGYKGFIQTRSLTCQKKMMSYISQPSIAIISK